MSRCPELIPGLSQHLFKNIIVVKNISKILSYIFHPLLIPTWFILLLLYSNPFSFAGMSILLTVLNVTFQTFLMPFIAILLLIKLDLVNSVELQDKQQRIIPLVITIIFYLWFYKASQSLKYPVVMSIFMLGAVVSLCLSFVINIFQKLSLHMVAISGALTAVLLLVFISPSDVSYYFLALVVLTGAIASARLYLNAHTMREVYTGFMVGMFGQVAGLFLYQIF